MDKWETECTIWGEICYTLRMEKIELNRPDQEVSFALWNQSLKEAERGDFEPEIEYNEEGQILAPNGAISNLPEYLVRITRTQAFKTWFGDWVNSLEASSKVIDPVTREPMRMYSGRSKDHGVNKFAGEHMRAESTKGKYFFTSRKKHAAFWGGLSHRTDTGMDYENFENENGAVYETFLNIRNPITVENHEELERVLYEIFDTPFDGAIQPLGLHTSSEFSSEYIVMGPSDQYVALRAAQIMNLPSQVGNSFLK